MFIYYFSKYFYSNSIYLQHDAFSYYYCYVFFTNRTIDKNLVVSTEYDPTGAPIKRDRRTISTVEMSPRHSGTGNRFDFGTPTCYYIISKLVACIGVPGEEFISYYC